MKTQLVEATQAKPEIKGARWRSLLISEGKGSSGYYSSDLLKEFGPKAFPKDTHIYFDHLSESEAEDRRGSHRTKDLVGVIENTPEFSESDNGLYANIKFFSEHKALMEEIAPYVGLSIEAGGELDEDGNVTAFYESPLNAVSVVPRAGRGGKLVELVESFRESSDRIDTNTPSGANAPGKNSERKPMNEQEIKALAEALALAIEPKFAALTEALTPVVVEPKDEKDVDEAAVVESAVEAGLSKASRVRVVEAVRAGATPEDAVKAEKDLREQILAEAATEDEATVGRVRESAESGKSYDVNGWK